jgi:hypothetical protein
MEISWAVHKSHPCNNVSVIMVNTFVKYPKHCVKHMYLTEELCVVFITNILSLLLFSIVKIGLQQFS